MMEHYISELDTQRFGFPIAKVNDFAEPVAVVLERLQGLGVRMVISRVPAERIALINEMERSGFQLKDIQVTYNFDLLRSSPPPVAGGQVIYRDFRPEDENDIQNIAYRAFQDYGHYAKDPQLGAVDTGRIYADWARRCCSGLIEVDKIVVAELAGRPAGYLAFRIEKDDQGPYTAGVMGAVDDRCQGLGVFRNINIMGLQWAAQEGLNRVEHNVLVTNFGVNRTYMGLGFRIIRSEVTFHCPLT